MLNNKGKTAAMGNKGLVHAADAEALQIPRGSHLTFYRYVNKK